MNLINKAQCRKLALQLSKLHRSGKFTRVSEEFLKTIDIKVQMIIFKAVKSHPSKGKTLTEVNI